MLRLLLPALLLLFAGCYAAHDRAPGGEPDASVPDAPSCPTERPRCVAREGDTCGPWQLVDPECGDDLAWQCPAGAREYLVEPSPPEVCVPFADAIARLGEAPIAVPDDDGCVWLLPHVETADGETVRYAAVRLDDDAPFGACPSEPRWLAGAPRTTLPPSTDPAALPSITGAVRVPGGPVRLATRLFRFEDGAPFGVREIGTGLATWNDTAHAVEGAAEVRWPTTLDLGDATLLDGGSIFLYGCPPPIDFLTEQCVLARLRASSTTEPEELWTGRDWRAGASPADAARIFDAGPWRSAVSRLPDGRYLHLYAVGFGTRLEAHVAAAPEGPWRPLGVLADCDLPRADEQSFCAGPAIHAELADPTRPAEIVVSYDVGTLAPDRIAADPSAYRTRLIRLALP